MLISVIIPLYNCEQYIKKAIQSVLQQEYVKEVIVIDDGSIDNSFKIVEILKQQYNKIKLLQHPDKKNHGRSATRNLGIKEATSKYIAFLDADDYYLPNRFENDIKILENESSIDGVYNAISAHFYRKSNKIENKKLKLTMIREVVNPENLFKKMGPIGHYGYFSGIGLIVRKDIFDKVGFFNEILVVAEDTELWLRMALKTKLVAGIINKPVAMRGVHENNVSFKSENLYNINNLRMYETLLKWSFENKISLKKIDLIWKKVWINRAINKNNFHSNISFWIINILKYPKLLKLKRVYKTFPIFKIIKNALKR